MRKATRDDKEKIIKILSTSYDTNPSINWIIKNDHRRLQRIEELASYSFEIGVERDGVFISSDGNGAAICFKYNYRKNSFRQFLLKIRFAWKALGSDGIPEALRRENYVKKILPPSGNFLYFWFFGVIPGKHGGNAAKELKDHIFKMSAEYNLPIYVETTLEKNRRVYERYGFSLYHTWNIPDKNFNLYFLKRNPKIL